MTVAPSQVCIIERLSRLFHSVCRIHEIADGRSPLPVWEECPPSIQEGTRVVVAALLEDPTVTGSTLHDEWVVFMRSKGWGYSSDLSIPERLSPLLLSSLDLPLGKRVQMQNKMQFLREIVNNELHFS